MQYEVLVETEKEQSNGLQEKFQQLRLLFQFWKPSAVCLKKIAILKFQNLQLVQVEQSTRFYLKRI